MRAWRLAAALACLHAATAAAEGGSSCPLTLDQQVKAVHAFQPIASFVTREPRCFNCHGGVNPHIDGVGPDPEDAGAPHSTVEHGGGRIPHDSRGTGTIPGGCNECHSHMARKRDGSKSNWMTAPASLSFVDKDAAALCRQFKGAARSAERFLGHLKDDNGGNNFSGTAFQGGCGLDPVQFEADLATGGACKPPSIGHGAFHALGEAWVRAMGGRFEGGDDCGCDVQGLLGRFVSTDAAELGPMRNVTRVTGELLWRKKDDAGVDAPGDAASVSFRPVAGEITVEVEFENRGFDGVSTCRGSGRRSFPVESLAAGALRLMELEIAADGGYRVMLVIPDMPDPFPPWSFDSACIFPNTTATQQVEVRHTSVTLGEQRGTLDEERGIQGSLVTPIRRGPRTITGSWSFDTAGAQ